MFFSKMSRQQIFTLIAMASINFSSMICYSILGPFFPPEVRAPKLCIKLLNKILCEVIWIWIAFPLGREKGSKPVNNWINIWMLCFLHFGWIADLGEIRKLSLHTEIIFGVVFQVLYILSNTLNTLRKNKGGIFTSASVIHFTSFT